MSDDEVRQLLDRDPELAQVWSDARRALDRMESVAGLRREVARDAERAANRCGRGGRPSGGTRRSVLCARRYWMARRALRCVPSRCDRGASRWDSLPPSLPSSPARGGLAARRGPARSCLGGGGERTMGTNELELIGPAGSNASFEEFRWKAALTAFRLVPSARVPCHRRGCAARCGRAGTRTAALASPRSGITHEWDTLLWQVQILNSEGDVVAESGKVFAQRSP